MFDIALSVLSCLAAGTEVHVAWIVSGGGRGADEAVALTPGGGRMGGLLDGALDHILVDAVPRIGEDGGLLRLTVGPAEAVVSGLPEGTELIVALLAGTTLPEGVWRALADRVPVAFAVALDGDRFTEAGDADLDGEPTVLTPDRLICRLMPTRRVVISGAGPIAEALSEAFALAGWSPSVFGDVAAAEGVMATLSAADAVVVMGHDVEVSGRALQAAIGSRAGYIGSVGSRDMQDQRERWLSFRGVGWTDRIHGPAGFDIGADNPGEIAISIVAEAVASRRKAADPDG